MPLPSANNSGNNEKVCDLSSDFCVYKTVTSYWEVVCVASLNTTGLFRICVVYIHFHIIKCLM